MKRTASIGLTFGLMALVALAFAAVSMGGDDPAEGATPRGVTTRPARMPVVRRPSSVTPRAPIPGRAPTRRRTTPRPSPYGYAPAGTPRVPGIRRPIAPAPDVPRSMAGCMLRVTYDSESLPGGTSTLMYLARSHGVLETAVDKALEKPPPYRLDVHIIKEDRRRTPILALCQMDLALAAENAEPQARKVLAAVTERLRKALVETAQRQRELIRTDLAVVRKQFAEAKAKMTELQQARAKMGAQAGAVELDRDNILSRIRKLESRRESLAVEVAGVRIRVDATQEQVSKLAAKAKAAAKEDPVSAELAKVVEFREFELRRREEAFRKGTATKAEIMEAAARVAEAKARLAERRQQAAAAAAGQLLIELNTQLVHDSIRWEEKEAQRKAVTDQLKPLRDPKLLELAERYGTIGVELDVVERRFYQVLKRQSDLESQLSTARTPTVIVLGG